MEREKSYLGNVPFDPTSQLLVRRESVWDGGMAIFTMELDQLLVPYGPLFLVERLESSHVVLVLFFLVDKILVMGGHSSVHGGRERLIEVDHHTGHGLLEGLVHRPISSQILLLSLLKLVVAEDITADTSILE